MFIEHMTDGNMTRTGRLEGTVSDMIDLQQALVADHISGLEREGAALRAEREREHAERLRAGHAAAGARSLPDGPPSPRVRLGRWLVGVGESIAGSAAPMARSLATDDRSSDDGADTLSHAA